MKRFRWIVFVSFLCQALMAAPAQTIAKAPEAATLLSTSRSTNVEDRQAEANQATPLARINVKREFQVERLYSVPADQQGSWINLCLDDLVPCQRLILGGWGRAWMTSPQRRQPYG